MFETTPINDQCWLICGGREFVDNEMFDSAMSDLVYYEGVPALVIEGGASGADAMGREWAKRLAVQLVTVRAEWDVHGRAAGPKRNQEMLDRYHPDLVIAFPGGRGTADMVRRSREAGVDVAEITPKKGEEQC